MKYKLFIGSHGLGEYQAKNKGENRKKDCLEKKKVKVY